MKNNYLRLILFLLALVVIPFALTSCAETMEQEDHNCKTTFRSNTLLTKTISDNLSAGIRRSDVENYLVYRKKISSEKIGEICRYDIDEENYIYIVNLIDGHWYLFSGDYSSTPILAEGETGGFSLDRRQNYHDKIWFDSIRNYQNDNRSSNSDEAQNNRKEWICSQKIAAMQAKDYRYAMSDTTEIESVIISDTLANDNYLPLTATSWYQIEPFNNATPLAVGTTRCPVGCAVIAIAQLLYYTHYAFGFPNQIYSNASCSSYYYQMPYNYSFSSMTSSTWDYMEPDPFDLPDNDPYTAALCAYISYKSGTYYDYDTTDGYFGATPPGNIASTLSFFSLTGTTSIPFSSPSVRFEVKHNRPVLCGGYGGIDYSEAHTYLIDGYKWLYIRDTEIITDMNGNIISQNIINEYSDLKWYINTGWYPNYPHILVAEGAYIPYYRQIYIGWSQN